MGYLRNIKKQYWISFFHSLIPAYVIERLFWQQRGMDVQMVVAVEIIYALTVTLGEIPSGILSDRFGRKRLLIVHDALAVTELILLLFANSFWQFAAAVFLAGVGKALASGSENALLYDSLLCEGKEDTFEKHLGRFAAVDLVGTMIAALSGGVFARFIHMEFNYILSVGSMSAAFLVALTLKEPPMQTKAENETSGAIKHAKQALALFGSRPLVLLYCLSGAVLGACLIYLDEFWQIVSEQIGVPVLFFGFVAALFSLLRMPGALLAYKLKGKAGYHTVFSCVIGVCAAGYTAVFALPNLFCLIPMMLVCFTAGITDPLVSGYLHRHTESRLRATAESFASLGLRAVSIVIGLAFGAVGAAFSIFAGFLLLGGICLVYLLLFRLFGQKHFVGDEKPAQRTTPPLE